MKKDFGIIKTINRKFISNGSNSFLIMPYGVTNSRNSGPGISNYKTDKINVINSLAKNL